MFTRSYPVPEQALTPRMVSVHDAAKMLNVCPATVRRNLPLQRVGDRTLIRMVDVQKITGEASNGRA